MILNSKKIMLKQKLVQNSSIFSCRIRSRRFTVTLGHSAVLWHAQHASPEEDLLTADGWSTRCPALRSALEDNGTGGQTFVGTRLLPSEFFSNVIYFTPLD